MSACTISNAVTRAGKGVVIRILDAVLLAGTVSDRNLSEVDRMTGNMWLPKSGGLVGLTIFVEDVGDSR